MAGFSAILREEAQPIWEAIFTHPFLRDIKDGTLPLETFQYYLGQDYHYLEGFGRAVALALAKSPDSELLQQLAHRVMTPVERPLHHRLIEAAGLDDGGGRERNEIAHQHRVRQPHADDCGSTRVGSHGGGPASMPVDLPPAER